MSEDTSFPAFGRTGPGNQPQAASASAMANLLCSTFDQRLMPHAHYRQGMNLPPYAVSHRRAQPRLPPTPKNEHPWPLHGLATGEFLRDLQSFEVAQEITSPPKPFEFTFLKDEVRFGLVGETVANLMSLTDHPALCQRLHQRMRLNFAHWRDDPREIVMIKEVRDFFQQVTQQWPYWLHFIEPAPDSMALLITLLTPSTHLPLDDHFMLARVDDTMPQTFQHMVQATLCLHDSLYLPPQITLQTQERLRECLLKTFQTPT